MKIIKANKNEIVFKTKLRKVGGNYSGIFIPKELERENWKAGSDVIISIKKKKRFLW